MKENFNIENEFDQLFKEQLSQHSSPVPSSVWSNISSGLVKKALIKSIFIKSLVISTVAVTSTVAYFSLKNDQNNLVSNNQPLEIQENKNIVTEIEHSDFSEKNAIEIVSEDEINKGSTDVKSKTSPLTVPAQSLNEIVTKENETQPVFLNPNIPLESKEIFTKIEENNDLLLEENPKVKEKDETSQNSDKPLLKDTLKIPNVFTPNGDGLNDTYLIEISSVESFEMIIFNKQLNRIFETKNKNYGWNGSLRNGEEAPDGEYIVKIIYKFKNKKEIEVKQQTIILKR